MFLATSEAWEACNITQKHAGLAAFSQFSERLNWKIMENGKWEGSSLPLPDTIPVGLEVLAEMPPCLARMKRPH
jgi:hypothetical protein